MTDHPFPIGDFVSAYIEALYFTDTGEGDQPPAEARLAPEARQRIWDECAVFLWRVHPYIDNLKRKAPNGLYGKPTISEIAHDYHYSRNGHGTGFWDPCSYEQDYTSELFDKVAQSFGTLESYLGDDGKIHVM